MDFFVLSRFLPDGLLLHFDIIDFKELGDLDRTTTQLCDLGALVVSKNKYNHKAMYRACRSVTKFTKK